MHNIYLLFWNKAIPFFIYLVLFIFTKKPGNKELSLFFRQFANYVEMLQNFNYFSKEILLNLIKPDAPLNEKTEQLHILHIK